jgi:hypothetical protein
MPNLICGPIIGHVSPRTANILLEFDETVENLEICITDMTSSNDMKSRNSQLSFVVNRPRTHTITQLEPAHNYRIEIVDKRIANPYTACFRTPLENSDELNVIGIAGWSEEMGDKILTASRSADVLIHCGNLVSTHNLFAELSNRDTLPTAAETEIELRAVYRRSLMRPKLRTLLSNCSNLAIWGEEESLSWQFVEDILEKLPFALRVAHAVYRDYLRALFDNDDSPYIGEKPREFFSIQIGRTAIMVIDTRGSRMSNFKLDRKANFLGNSQKRMIKEVDRINPLNIIFVSDIPFVSISNESYQNPVSSNMTEWPCQEIDMKEIFAYAHERSEKVPGGSVLLLAGGGECGFTSIIGHDNCCMYQGVVGSLDHKLVPLNIPSVLRYKRWTITHREVIEPTWARVQLMRHNGRIRGSIKLEGVDNANVRAKLSDIDATIPIENSIPSDVTDVMQGINSQNYILTDVPQPPPPVVADAVPVISENDLDNEYKQLLDEVSSFNASGIDPRMSLNTDGTATDGIATDGSSPVSSVEKLVAGLAQAAISKQ